MKYILIVIISLTSCTNESLNHRQLTIINDCDKCVVYALSEKGETSYRDFKNIKEYTISFDKSKPFTKLILDSIGKGEKALCFSPKFAIVYKKKNEIVELLPCFTCSRVKIFSSTFPQITAPSKLRPGETTREDYKFLSIDNESEKEFKFLIYQSLLNE